MIAVTEENFEQLRIQVAERLGWRSIEYSNDGYLVGYPVGRKLFAVVPSYARDIKAAWTLIDYLSFHGIHVKLEAALTGQNGRYCTVELEYQGKPLSRAQDRTAPLAICRAFLRIPGERLACSSSRMLTI